jgi:oligoribonuclease NrnB/cAMP/cGMP phosphodiesterase (DHH superfamily)
MNKVFCFYHSADLDGHCSGAIVAMTHPDCVLFGINYGQEFPWKGINPSGMVYVVDFCLQPFSNMLRLQDLMRSGGGRLIWIDHHRSAIDDYVRAIEEQDIEEIEGVRKLELAGCELTWQFLYPDRKMPRAVRLIGRHDVWDHADDNVEPFQYGMRLYETRPQRSAATWNRMLSGTGQRDGFVYDTIEAGKKIMRYQHKQDEIYLKSTAFETDLDGLHLLACNRACANSKIFDSMWPKFKNHCDAMALFAWLRDRWEVKLFTDHRSLDVSLIAKARGGGGHQMAAGFQCAVLPFELR